MGYQNSANMEALPTWVEVRRDQAMGGSGLFATRDIPRGTRIIAEVPIIATMPGQRTETDKVKRFCQALLALPEEKAREIDTFYCDPARNNLGYREVVRTWYKDSRITDSDGNVLEGKKLQDAVEKSTKRWAAFSTNAVEMGNDEDDNNSIGLFPLFSRINHSCVPNSYNNWNHDIQRHTVHVGRDIRADEQIFNDYIGNPYLSRRQRAELLEHWGFTCQCVACTDKSVDKVRTRIRKLHHRLSPIPEVLGSAARQGMPVQEALTATDELINLLKGQELGGAALCRVYRECSVYNLDAEELLKAVESARLELDLERTIYGPETEYLRGGLQGAEYWLAQLEKILSAPTPSERKEQEKELERLMCT